MMNRVVTAEVLDGLPQYDLRAIRSRRDLRRVHRAMGTRRILVGALDAMKLAHLEVEPLRVLELGAGDGSLMLGVAQELAGRWPSVALTLLDRQALATPATVASYLAVGSIWKTSSNESTARRRVSMPLSRFSTVRATRCARASSRANHSDCWNASRHSAFV